MKNKNKAPIIKTKRLLLTETDSPGKWSVKTADGNTNVGEAAVTVSDYIKKTAEIKYEICPEHKGEGYAAEMITAVTDYVFGGGTVYFMRISVGSADKARGEMLSACGFTAIGADDENAEVIVYEKEKPKPAFMSIYMMLGMSSGMCLGIAGDKMAVGMCIGMAAGMALGLALDRLDEVARKR